MSASRSRSRVRLWGSVAAAAALLGALAVWGISRAGEAERPVALASVPPGGCYRLPSPDYVRSHLDAFRDGLPRQVVPVACGKPHRGEVVGQTFIDAGRIVIARDSYVPSFVACQDLFADADPDAWALPVNVIQTIAMPTEQDLTGRHPKVTCSYDGQDIPVTGTLRADTSRLTAGQRRYLAAVRPYDKVSSEGLDTRDWIRNDELTAWAKDMAAAEQRTIDELASAGAPSGAEQPFAALLDRHRQAVTAWQAAAAATDPQEIRRQITAARAADHAAMDPDRAVRAALGLTTEMRPSGYSL